MLLNGAQPSRHIVVSAVCPGQIGRSANAENLGLRFDW